MKTIKDPVFTIEKKASRLALFLRWLLGIIYGLVLAVIGFIAGFALCIQFFYILILGKRNKRIAEFVRGFVTYTMKVSAYMNYVTDERPPFWPENL